MFAVRGAAAVRCVAPAAVRGLAGTPALRAGASFRVSEGRARSADMDGPLRTQPDWVYAGMLDFFWCFFLWVYFLFFFLTPRNE